MSSIIPYMKARLRLRLLLTKYERDDKTKQVKDLVEENPHVLYEPCLFEYLPLHCILWCNLEDDSTFPLVQYFVEKNPQALEVPSDDGMLPLHHACLRQKSLNVVRFLVDSFPDALRISDRNGCLPLHYVNSEHSLEVLHFLIEQYPQAVQKTDNYGSYPLDIVCFGDTPSLEAVRTLVETFPPALRTPEEYGLLPLHTAVMSSKNSDSPDHLRLLSYLIDQYPDALKHPDELGRLPLYFACKKDQGRSLEQILLLARRYPQAITACCPGDTHSSIQKVPLAYAFSQILPLLLEEHFTIRSLKRLKRDNQEHRRILDFWDITVALLWIHHVGPDREEERPRIQDVRDLSDKAFQRRYAWMLSAAASLLFLKEFDTIHLVARLFDDSCALDASPYTGMTPLQTALSALPPGQAEEKIQSLIELVVDWNPMAVHIADANNRFPLAYALRAGMPWGLVEYFLEQWPSSILLRHVNGMTMYELAIASPNCSVDVAYRLLRDLYPSRLVERERTKFE